MMGPWLSELCIRLSLFTYFQSHIPVLYLPGFLLLGDPALCIAHFLPYKPRGCRCSVCLRSLAYSLYLLLCPVIIEFQNI
ncbi:hypothetical protein BDN72DRAFT_72098 [Pluteus cervinus]|uniref:Uncharacterized protein n=1 Tax=Pluteus cervinus TaxID=181527 RepID=A0ACD3AQ43_9AGAR|nr:hypothetical protein BDN72DRAFT_72098 [Pluteus cervinus]